MSNALAEYLSALDARDAREQAHRVYINAYTKLADRTAAQARPTAAARPASDSTRTTQSAAPQDTAAPQAATAPQATAAQQDATAATALGQLRAELAATQKTRAGLESRLGTLAASLAALQASDAQQKQRIAQLETHRAHLERRGKDKQDELKGKGRFVEEMQDEMVALHLQLNMAEQERDTLRRDNEELTRRWVSKMEAEASRMNQDMGWEEQRGSKRGSKS
ncbi:autophagy protein 16 [Didymella exigua CBS 183.55]|uniref:Autophagy protein 16 n=1 Tax=Didymella exigua CBS 183.55 TaxID=1150837 RepID=A0A6A5RK10_9PLEO|nr:autophagy protein 16 [Didymella exigua CBS 183.55]KAF1927600.1 autophagy protein 16 [Didymella exigua CBS 183.55]